MLARTDLQNGVQYLNSYNHDFSKIRNTGNTNVTRGSVNKAALIDCRLLSALMHVSHAFR